jgi:DNA-binding transcriptional MerR regulator/methylmalonyl-CoA mutase cobalamin-binding subunit
MYTIKEAAARAGVTPTVARAWERRYGVVEPARTASGYRLYDETAIERLRTMRRLVAEGWTASAAAHAVADGTVPAAGPGAAGGRPTAGAGDPIEAFVSAAAAVDGDAIEAALDELFGRGSFEAIVDTWLMPAAAALGDAWETGRVSVAGEHAASAALARRLAGAFEAAARVDGRPAVVGLPPGSRHELGALAFATALRRRGIPVLYLGADVPVPSWLDLRAQVQPRLLVVAVVTAEDRTAASDVARALRAADDPTPVAFGGRAAGAPAEAIDGSTVLPDSIVAAADRAVGLLGA